MWPGMRFDSVLSVPFLDESQLSQQASVNWNPHCANNINVGLLWSPSYPARGRLRKDVINLLGTRRSSFPDTGPHSPESDPKWVRTFGFNSISDKFLTTRVRVSTEKCNCSALGFTLGKNLLSGPGFPFLLLGVSEGCVAGWLHGTERSGANFGSHYRCVLQQVT